MININDLKGRSAISLLKAYEGMNPYLRKLKKEYLKNNKVKLTENQTKYIVNFHNVEPQLINRVINISEYLGGELKKQGDLSFTPERLLVEFMLADTEKTYHVYGKLKRNQKKSEMYWLPKTQVLDDPYFEDINIEVDFDKYEKLDKLKRVPYEHQKTGIKFLLARNGCILADDMGLGKRIANDVPVLTPSGWVPHGTLKVGDYVIGSNGKPTKVLSTHPSTSDDYYKITFTDGTIVESCDEHLWAVQTTNQKKSDNGFTVKPLKELIGDLTYGTKGNVKWYIPMVKAVEFNERNIDIDPYLLGCLLGDGGFSGNNISENCNSIIKGLKDYSLMGCKSIDKFIPDDYKYNTKEIRLEILQGLLDTDGYCSKSGGAIQFYSVSKKLIDDVKEIVQSFGGVAIETSKIGKYKKPDGTIIECELCYTLTINMPENVIPFKLQHKIDNLKTVRKHLPSRGIKSIEYSRNTSGQCISVEADDHLYVMDKYVVTHNTYQAIVAALESGVERILIVCPSAVKINWEREINNFDDNTVIVSGRKWNRDKFTIINYDILKNFHTLGNGKDEDGNVIEFNRELVHSKFDLCIIDEAHYLKNHKSIRGEIMQDLCVKHGIEKVWLLTGTPIANRPMDFYSLLKLIKAPIADNWKFFAQRYCDGKTFFKTFANGRRKQIWITDGASNLEELSVKTKNIILRRKKEEVLDMPSKIVSANYYELSRSSRNEYEDLWEQYLIERKKLKKKGKTPDKELVELILLRRFIANQAIPYTIEDAENAIAQGQKVIIFTSFTDELNELAEHFGNRCVTHNGKMSATNKQKSVDRFMNNDKIKVFIGNIISAGVGITLTAANYIIFNSYSWVPGDNDQAEDRAYRIGQKYNVTVKYQLFVNSISNKMWSTLQNKRAVIETIMGERGIDEQAVERRIMEDLILEDYESEQED